ncbi:MAG: glycosyltransferase family 2 protein [Anaerolineales bacterium]
METPLLSVIILTFNEAVHLERCLNNVRPLGARLYIVDSGSTDATLEIARRHQAEIWEHPFVNQAEQFQWALENLEIQTPWLMRLDADEYLEAQALTELADRLPGLPAAISGIYLRRKVYFQRQWIRHGGFYPQTLLRVWRTGQGRIEQRWMDEHMVLPPGAKTITLRGQMVDENLKGLTFWIDKHNRYASREAADLLNNKYALFPRDESLKQLDDPQARRKRLIKEKIYSKLPPGPRALLYFLYRYIFLLGFLDGANGFTWHFMQGFWYRFLVDVKMMEIEKRAGGEIEKIRQILREEHGISL